MGRNERANYLFVEVSLNMKFVSAPPEFCAYTICHITIGEIRLCYCIVVLRLRLGSDSDAYTIADRCKSALSMQWSRPRVCVQVGQCSPQKCICAKSKQTHLLTNLGQSFDLQLIAALPCATTWFLITTVYYL